MVMETEITVLVKSDYEVLKRELEKNEFQIKEKYELKDVYMIDKDKKYDVNGDILEQGKVECPVIDIEKAIGFMESINYKKLFNIYDRCIVYANKETELVVQLVNDKYIFIEMESECEHIKRKYNSVEELKNDINRYNLPIDNSNYFVKKAELILSENISSSIC